MRNLIILVLFLANLPRSFGAPRGDCETQITGLAQTIATLKGFTSHDPQLDEYFTEALTAFEMKKGKVGEGAEGLPLRALKTIARLHLGSLGRRRILPWQEYRQTKKILWSLRNFYILRAAVATAELKSTTTPRVPGHGLWRRGAIGICFLLPIPYGRFCLNEAPPQTDAESFVRKRFGRPLWTKYWIRTSNKTLTAFLFAYLVYLAPHVYRAYAGFRELNELSIPAAELADFNRYHVEGQKTADEILNDLNGQLGDKADDARALIGRVRESRKVSPAPEPAETFTQK